ncbi:hypothetical protein PS906_01177 [Pseudomonas fluorescens]|nr:hypothetical protein PS906_01177 [Pseudomonas fluorescens]
MVPEAGIEPARPYERGILSPLFFPYKSEPYGVYFSASRKLSVRLRVVKPGPQKKLRKEFAPPEARISSQGRRTWVCRKGLTTFTVYSSILNPLSTTLSAKRPTAVKLAQVRSDLRRERTGTQRATLPPRRIDRPSRGHRRSWPPGIRARRVGRPARATRHRECLRRSKFMLLTPRRGCCFEGLIQAFDSGRVEHLNRLQTTSTYLSIVLDEQYFANS